MAPEHKVPLSQLANTKAVRHHTERVCLRTFSLDTVKKTCYRFASKHVEHMESDECEARVRFAFPSTVSEEQATEVLKQFNDDLLDQDLRESVATRTESVRTLILANAFANSDLADESD